MVIVERFPDQTDPPDPSPFKQGAAYRVRKAFHQSGTVFHAGEVLTNLSSLWSHYDSATRFGFRDDLGNRRQWWLGDDDSRELPKELFELVPPTAGDHQHNPDSNANASRIVAESTSDEKSQPADVEAAWLAWSARIQKVDERGMSLLRLATRQEELILWSMFFEPLGNVRSK